jgi:KDO2-lipid IV(A) lauroyltransferase
MKTLQHYLEYGALRCFALIVAVLPLRTNRWIACRLADFAFYCVPIRRKVVIGNLTAAFRNDKTPREIRRIARDTYRQFAQTMIELLYFPRLSPAEIRDLVQIEGAQLIELTRQLGKGAVFVGAHFGNWELMGAALALHAPVSFVIGKQENSMVDDLLNSYRVAKGIKLIPLKMALRGVMKVLKSNEFIAILADQDAHEHGAFVNFFGRPASTPKGPAMFALRAGCPLITGHIFRTDDGRFKIIFEAVPRPEPTGNEQLDIERYTAAFAAILEKYTRQHPDHWFWMHRRWKTSKPLQPAAQ